MSCVGLDFVFVFVFAAKVVGVEIEARRRRTTMTSLLLDDKEREGYIICAVSREKERQVDYFFGCEVNNDSICCFLYKVVGVQR